MQLGGEFLADEPGELCGVEPGEFADRMDAIGGEPLFRLFADPEEVAHAERPHLFFDLAIPEGMHPVRLLEIRGHLREELV